MAFIGGGGGGLVVKMNAAVIYIISGMRNQKVCVCVTRVANSVIDQSNSFHKRLQFRESTALWETGSDFSVGDGARKTGSNLSVK